MSTARAAATPGRAAGLSRAAGWLATRRGAVWGGAGALLLGAFGQALLDAKVAPGAAAAALALAAALFLAGPGRRAAAVGARDEADVGAAARLPGIHIAVAVGLAAVAFPLLAGNRFSVPGTVLWLAALGLLGAAALPAGARKWGAWRHFLRRASAARGLYLSWSAIALLAFLAVGALFRFHLLAEIPREVGPDVPHVYENIRTILSGEYPVFFPSHPGREGLFFYLAAPLARLFGASHTTIKAASALVGLASIPLLYLLGRELYGRGVGLAAAGLLSISHWHIICSRSGLRAGTLLPLMMLAWLWLVRGLRRGRRWEFYLAGLALGLGMYTYNAFAAVPLAGAAMLAWEALAGRGRRLWAQRANLALAGIVALVVFVPLGRYAYDEPG
ncbi:MAG: glycosyltransferase family 39 protein, partial [Chloroflexi bacterium]|nr:glycosyltransferase family 39 protein [Chloroflexota bacterium]